MTQWADFYNSIKDASWPNCDHEKDFALLPDYIQQECKEVFGYQPGLFQKSSPLPHKIFPIKTDTACQLKWNWSTVYLTTGKTASCHRTDTHTFNFDTFNFHNTPQKLQDRNNMLQGKWPSRGCDYCKDIERAGGRSDRITNLDFPGIHYPKELDTNPHAVSVTPRILEIYFDNTCDLKCLYCGSHFSSLWEAENRRYGDFVKGDLRLPGMFIKNSQLENNKQKLFNWIRDHGHDLTVLNILGGEPLYQSELDAVLELLKHHPIPELKLQIFSNLNARPDRVRRIVESVKALVDTNCIREFEITASLDCWGPQQEYVRFPLNLNRWEQNFEYLINETWINLIVSSTVTPLTVKTLPDLLEKILTWKQKRTIYHYQNSVNSPSYLFIDIFGDIFTKDFEKALALKPESSPEEISSKQYLEGIALQSKSKEPNINEITKLFDFLNEMDRRRSTDWTRTFPWLVSEFEKFNLRR